MIAESVTNAREQEGDPTFPTSASVGKTKTDWLSDFCAERYQLRAILCDEVISAGAVDLSAKIGAVRLRNPILAASGTFGYGLEFAHVVDLNRLGGFVTKGLSREPIEGAPAPPLYPPPPRMPNALGPPNVGAPAFVT